MKFKKIKLVGRITPTIEWDNRQKQYVINCKFFSAIGHGKTIEAAIGKFCEVIEQYYLLFEKNQLELDDFSKREWKKLEKNFRRV